MKEKLLHFNIKQTKKGWIAECQEIAGIITGGPNPQPSQAEISSQIKSALRAAFNLPGRSSSVRFPVGLTLTVGVTSHA